jgi:sulfoxide reductase heme-binding subunit YedZ
MRVPTWAIVASSAAVALLIALGGLIHAGGWTAEGVGAATRLTARWSFPWFIAAWSASALAVLWTGGWRTVLLRRRRAVGLAFAANHGVHLAALTTGAVAFGAEVHPITLIVGGGVYVLIALMAATSNDAAVRWLGTARWRLLHTIGGWGLLLVFTNSYVGRVPEKPWLGVPAVGIIALALLLRAAAWWTRHRRAQAAA